MQIKSCFNLGCDAVKHKQKFNGILGISVGSRNFSKKNIEEYLEFCLEYFNRTLVIIVDSIKKYNFMAFYDIPEKKAIEKVMLEGDEFLIAVKRVLKNMKHKKLNTSKINTVRWSKIVNILPEYQKTVKILKEFYKSNKAFYTDALHMAETYIEARSIKELNQEKKNLAINFLLEETALFLLIGTSTKEEYCIDIYPGKFLIIQNILENKYNDLLERLPGNMKYGHIELLI